MARKVNYLLAHHYLRFHLWLRHWCERLTIRQRKAIVYGLSFIYLICSLWMAVCPFNVVYLRTFGQG